jgi:hypothetical protein
VTFLVWVSFVDLSVTASRLWRDSIEALWFKKHFSMTEILGAAFEHLSKGDRIWCQTNFTAVHLPTQVGRHHAGN